MTQTKKILSILLSMILLFSVCPTGVFDFTAGAETVSSTCGNNLTWQYNTSTYTLTISGTGTMTDYSSSKYNGTSTYVTDAPWRSYYDTMKTVIINSGVTSIGEHAFHYCTGLTSITIPDSVTSIGYSAFSGCTGLTSVTIPDSVTSLENYAFYDCTELTSITIGNSVTSIGDFVFSYCTGLTSITIPDSVTSIGGSAFYGCTSLESFTIGNRVTSIGREAFYNCTSLNKVNISDIAAWCNILFVAHYSNPLYYAHNLYLNGKLVIDLVIPDSVTSIGIYAFYGCTGLTSITIPESVTRIGNNAFLNNTVICGFPSTAAETFAYSNGNRFIPLPDFIEIFSVKKQDYYIGSEMEPNSVIIAAYFADGEVKFYYKNFTVSGFDTSKHGKKTVTVSYYGKTATFTINVSRATADDLTTIVDMMLGKGKADEKYDLNNDGNVNILDLIKMKKEIANM